MRYEFRCLNHPDEHLTIYMNSNDIMNFSPGACKLCGESLEQNYGKGDRSWFAQTFGKWTGVYDYDYGKKATWDLTPKGKMAELTRMGKIGDPFNVK